jgi:hypothetical protein
VLLKKWLNLVIFAFISLNRSVKSVKSGVFDEGLTGGVGALEVVIVYYFPTIFI